ncbi:MAG: helix-turn-helix domain-containing protein [Actinomycetaceae bacterium]|nr:helix-turn-helix domain-containing protein [Actinomycetaceae bacterium]
MSFEALNWAQHDLPELSMGEAFTLMCLANYADENNSCYPSQEQLARDVHTSHASVKRHLKRLRELGLICVKSRSSLGGRKTNRYILNVGMKLSSSETAGQPATAQNELLGKHKQDLPVDNSVSPQVNLQQLKMSHRTTGEPATAQNEPSQQLTGEPLHIYSNHHLETPTPYQVSKEARLSREVASLDGGVVGVDDFVNAVVDRELLDKALPASWLGSLPHNAQARLSRDIAGWVAKGGNPADIRRRLENDALPPVIKNFSGLVIHRVSQALEAVSPLSREEKKQARRNEIQRLAEDVLSEDKRPTQRMWVQLSSALSELNSSSDAELYGLVEQAYRKISDNLYSHV